jgi:hypothetical protein
MLIVWAACVQGEGASLVTYSIVNSLIRCDLPFRLVCSAGSKLDCMLGDLCESISVIKMPSFFSFYPVQALLRLLLPIRLFCSQCLVMDDYPFLLGKRQVLYFHQSNILYNQSFRWRIKKAYLRLCVNRDLLVVVQTDHVLLALAAVLARKKVKIIRILHFIGL